MTLAFAPERIEQWPLARLQPYAKNAKLHGDDQVARLAASMAEFGWTVPCLVGEDGELIAGHGRVLAATQLGLTEAPVIVLANATSDTVNTIKAANEFGITKGQTIVPSIMFINDIHALGLKHGQGMVFTTGFYWDRNDDTRAWARRFFGKMKKMPSMVHAGDYSAVT